jgi:hypothetical protein
MPQIPPTAVRKTDGIDKKLSPHRFGINPPMVDPTIIPNIIIDFELIR